MKYYLLLSLLLVANPVMSKSTTKSCDDKAAELGAIRYQLEDHNYERKLNPAFTANSAFKSGNKYLFCSKSANKSCSRTSVWFTYDQYVKYLASYKPVVCSYMSSSIQIKGGKQTRWSGMVYYLKSGDK